ncbi:hypothetical protein Bhyg_10341, partial [Pseudolycoriella hygida]
MKLKRKSRRTKLLQQQRTDDHNTQIGGIPMKCRKFPKSFWQQPNRPNQNIYHSIVDKNEIQHTRTGHIKITSAPDTNLLFSLFKILKDDRDVGLNDGETAGNNSIDSDKKIAIEDEENFKELTCLDDPLISPKEDCRGLKKSLKSSKNYSELLSDLVINL